MSRSTVRLALVTGLAVAGSSLAVIFAEHSSKATEGGVSLLADEEEAGLLSGPASYARMSKAITICNDC